MIINHNLETDRIKALIFDVDGTLSDSDDRMVETLYERLLFLRSVFPGERLLRFSRWFIHSAEGPGNWFLEMADRLNLDHLIAAYFDRRANSKAHLPHHFPLIPGVMPMLETLIGRYPVAIVTARNEVTTREFLRTNALDGYFPIVISSQTCKKTKPFPEPLLHAADRMNVPIENCLMIGDTVTDVGGFGRRGAISLGLVRFGRKKNCVSLARTPS